MYIIYICMSLLDQVIVKDIRQILGTAEPKDFREDRFLNIIHGHYPAAIYNGS